MASLTRFDEKHIDAVRKLVPLKLKRDFQTKAAL